MEGRSAGLTVALEEGTPLLIKISGEADYNNRHQITRAADRLLSEGHTRLRADLAGLRYIDSSALAAFLGFAVAVREHGGTVELVGASGHVARLLNQCGAAMFFKSYVSEVPVAGDSEPELTDGFWNTFDFVLPACPHAAATARQRVGDVLRSLPLTTAENADVLIAFGEALTNAIRHGCGCRQDLEIRVRCVAGPKRLTIDVTDPGPGFNPTAVPKPSPEAIVEGGMGIWIMRELMDEVSWWFADDHTTTRIVKLLGSGVLKTVGEEGGSIVDHTGSASPDWQNS